MAVVKYNYVIKQVRRYCTKYGNATVFWDWGQMAPRVRARGSWVMGDGQLIGVYNGDVDDEQIVDDVEATRKELGLVRKR